jgi:phage tail-like protein
MERGITHDAKFEEWANMIHAYAGDPTMDLANYKKELTLEVMNERGHVAKRYFIHDAWISTYTTMPDLDANANAIAIESLTMEIGGWERDVETKEPDEKSAVPAAP